MMSKSHKYLPYLPPSRSNKQIVLRRIQVKTRIQVYEKQSRKACLPTLKARLNYNGSQKKANIINITAQIIIIIHCRRKLCPSASSISLKKKEKKITSNNTHCEKILRDTFM